MALGIGLIATGVGALAGGALQAGAAKSAANTQAQSGQAAIAEQKREFDIGQQNLGPYKDVGQAAVYKLADALGLPGVSAPPPPITVGGLQYQPGGTTGWQVKQGGEWVDLNPDTTNFAQLNSLQQQQAASTPAATPSSTTGSLLKPFSFDISQDPGYQFRLDEGTKAVENSAAARGSQLSGATLKELLKYGSDYASGEYNAAFARDQATKNQVYSMLTGAAGMGQGATTTGVQAGQQTASSIGNTITGIGNAQAAGTIGSANAISGGIQGVGQGLLLKQAFANTNPGVSNVNAGVNLSGLEAGPG